MTNGNTNGNGRRIEKATTYVSLTLTILLVGMAYRFGVEMSATAEQLKNVPTRDEVRLIVHDAIKPLEQDIHNLQIQITQIKAQIEREGG